MPDLPTLLNEEREKRKNESVVGQNWRSEWDSKIQQQFEVLMNMKLNGQQLEERIEKEGLAVLNSSERICPILQVNQVHVLSIRAS